MSGGIGGHGHRVDAAALAGQGRGDQLATLRRAMEAVGGGVASASRVARVPEHEVLAVPGALGEVLPAGGLVRGQVTACPRGSVLAGLLAAVTGAGRTAAVIGGRSLGLLSAHEFGARLDRLWVVEPGPDPLAVLSILTEALDMVVLDVDDLTVTPAGGRPVLAKVRNHGCALVLSGRRIRGLRADLTLAARTVAYDGLGAGFGRVRAIHVMVSAGERGRAARTTHLVAAPAADGAMGWSVQHAHRTRRRLPETG
ncbi:hypothetical protein [Nocardia sp. NBC_01377]|uniref:hypothetical protein n=1 Tax=Nocardia sp. NBC_01377 TaxID=2903595 RepID=UPI002F90DF97